MEMSRAFCYDLDPGEGVEWASVVETALILREVLRAEGL
jgi:bifunctional non-homologous end joining protein LigD